MIEIKFRAWRNDKKYMIYNIAECQYGGEYQNGDPTSHEQEHNFHEYLSPDARADATTHTYEIMQFIGLYDNSEKRKEIYVKDILEFPNGDRCVVRMEDYLEIYLEWIGEPECEDQGRKLTKLEYSKVIGNIYENPELLKETNHERD